MKTTRTYLDGCKHCGAIGSVLNPNFNPNITLSHHVITCPVCQGSKTVLVTETIED
jgi:hypothetical protein